MLTIKCAKCKGKVFRYLKIGKGRVLHCECQSGFDGRILMQKPQLAELLKKARFENIRVAWDFPCTEKAIEMVEGWIKLLEEAGYNRILIALEAYSSPGSIPIIDTV